MKKSLLISLILLSMVSCFFAGCGNSTPVADTSADTTNTTDVAEADSKTSDKTDVPDVPFSEFSFDSSLEDVMAGEGEDYETYDSIYDGTTYTYDKKYLDRDGTVKYMFNQDEVLVNIAWTASCSDATEAMTLYNDALSAITEEYGEPTKNADGFNNYAQVWKSPAGNIIVSAVTTSDTNMAQIAFLSPLVAK